MPYRHWLFIAALGIAVSASTLGQAQEQGQRPGGAPAEQQGQTPAPRAPIPIEIIERKEAAEARERREAEASQREKDDLVAQQGMNIAAQAMNDANQVMARYARFSAALVAVGTVLLIWTLLATRQANKAAQDAVTVTREIGNAQLRAYVGMASGGATLYESANMISGSVVLQNYGQTPAHDVIIWITSNILPSGEVFDLTARTDGAENSRGPMMPSQQLIVAFRQNITKETLGAIRDKKQAIFVRGRIDYVDSFKRNRTTFISYRMLGREFKFVDNKPEVLGWGLVTTEHGNEAT